MLENLEEYAQQMKRKYMTYDVLYEDYLKTTDNPYGYTQFKAIIQEYEKNHDYKYHNVYEPGREMQFDFAGDNLWIVDKSTGEAIPAIVLVCVLPYSMLSYVTALPSAKWNTCSKPFPMPWSTSVALLKSPRPTICGNG